MLFLESRTQQAIIKYSKLSHIDVFSIPNGADVSAVNRTRLKGEGLLPGVPDLFFPIANKGFHGLFMEVKSNKGKLSKEQKTVMKKLTENGYKCVVVFSLDNAIKEIESYLRD